MMENISRWLLIFGAIAIVLGIIFRFLPDSLIPGKLPGDIHLKKGNFHFYFPLATSIALSVILTIVLWLIQLFRNIR